jgi:pimeloyl-ACP methyl ester carboxylesterase
MVSSLKYERTRRCESLTAWASWGVSIVNGFWGDYLQEHGNGLALDMAFYHRDRPLALTGQSITRAHPQASPRLCILMHGLSCNEHIWSFDVPTEEGKASGVQGDYGSLLQAKFGYTPFYLRYNTGLSIAQNGRALANLLQSLFDCYPTPVQEILLIGHSMGGLVLRSACHYAGQHQESWVQQVGHILYLGTPHDGADLEKATYNAVVVLQAAPNRITRLISDALNSRSRGIKDLRYGTLLEPDVMDEGWDDLEHHHRRAVPWLAHAQHYLVGGTWNADPEHVLSALLGDGLVCAPDNHGGAISEEHIRLLPGIRHLQLARNWEVYQQIAAWLQAQEKE